MKKRIAKAQARSRFEAALGAGLGLSAAAMTLAGARPTRSALTPRRPHKGPDKRERAGKQNKSARRPSDEQVEAARRQRVARFVAAAAQRPCQGLTNYESVQYIRKCRELGRPAIPQGNTLPPDPEPFVGIRNVLRRKRRGAA